jgi:serine/threonine-protein kinase
VAERFLVERTLGVGGMGVVLQARHMYLDARVAIKFLLPGALKDQSAVARFLREAKNAVRIRSEHVVRMIDVNTLPGGAPYVVMEYLSGVDLGALLEQRGPLPVDETVDYVLQACEAIAEAHALGIVHRDLKPANLFLTRRPDGSPLVKVLDFGISKAATGLDGPGHDKSLTKTDTMMGSPLFMSPEQVKNAKQVDVRTDVWALGVILYQLLTGRSPFEADTVLSLCAAILTEDPPPPASVRSDIPPVLDALILKCLQRPLESRVQSVAELAQGLAPYGSAHATQHVERILKLTSAGVASTGAPRPSAPVAVASGDVVRTEKVNSSPPEPEPPPRRQRAWVWALVGAAGALLVAGVAAVALLSMRAGPDHRTPSVASGLRSPPQSRPAPAAPAPPAGAVAAAASQATPAPASPAAAPPAPAAAPAATVRTPARTAPAQPKASWADLADEGAAAAAGSSGARTERSKPASAREATKAAAVAPGAKPGPPARPTGAPTPPPPPAPRGSNGDLLEERR